MPRKKIIAGTIEAPVVRAASLKGATVTVANKLPMHLELQLCRPFKRMVPGRFGSEEETIHVKHGQIVYVRGTTYPNGTRPKGFPKPPNVIEDENGGYALTQGVDAEWWAEWLDQNRDTEMVKNGLIFAHSQQVSLESIARQHEKMDSGLGPMNPEVDEKGAPLDRRSPRPINLGLTVHNGVPGAAATINLQRA